jgi:hypothetical protein
MCGRAGFTYDTHEEHGKREFEKTGVRMKAEGETGFEPNLLVLMERWEDVNTKPVVVKRTATVLKDRSDCIDGKQFESPRFSDFLPHIEALNLGGEHIRIDPSRSSKASIERPDFGPHYEREQKNVVLDEIDCLLLKHYPSQTKEDKAKRGDLLERHVGSRSWERVRTYALNDLQQGYKSLKSEFEGGPGRDDAPFTVPLSNSPAPAESGIPF